MTNLKTPLSTSLFSPLLASGGRIKFFLAILSVASAGALSAHGQIVWGPLQTITADTDISLAGTYVDAAGAFASGGETVPVTVGATTTDVDFHGLTLTSGTSTPPDSGTYSDGDNISISNVTGDNGGDSYTGNAPGVDVYYSQAISGVAYTGDGGTSTGTVTLSGLTAGQLYQVEVWQAHQDSSNVTNTTYMSAGGTNSAQTTGLNYILGTFVAGSSDTQVFTFTGSVGEISALQLRDLGTAVPEPNTLALLAAGLIGLTLVARSRAVSLRPNL